MAAPELHPFGRLLKRARRAAGLTQEAFAAQVGYSSSYIGMLERGERTPAPATVTVFAEALGVSAPERTAWLVAAEQPRQASPTLPAPASSAHARFPLVGRVAECAVIEQHLRGSGPPLLLLAGEPGIGKSRLLGEAGQRGREQGWTVLSGGCHRRSGQEPFAPLLTALEGRLHSQVAVQQQRELQGCAWLVQLLPELAEVMPTPVPAWAVPPEQERRLMFAAVARYLANVAGPAGTLLVLDDLQWAGADALDLLVSLLRTPREQPLRVMGAYRSTEVFPTDPQGVVLADLASAGLTREYQVRPLAPSEASELLTSVLEGEQHPEGALREQILSRTGGVPYFLVSCAEALRAGASAQHPPQDVPWNVAQSIGQRVAALPPMAQGLLDAAAVVGRETPGALLLALSGQPAAETVTALEVLGQARLLVEGAEARYQFPHDLIREVVLSAMSAVRRARVHQQVAEALEQASGDLPTERLAYHYARAGVREKAAVYLEQAGDQAQALYANAAAEGHYRALVTQVDALRQTAAAAGAREKLGKVLITQARYGEALEILEQALTLYQANGTQEGQWRTLATIGLVHAHRGTALQGLDRLEPVVEALPTDLPSSMQAPLYVALAVLFYTLGQYGKQLGAAERAAAAASGAGEHYLLCQAKHWRAVALACLGRPQEASLLSTEVVALAEQSRDLEILSHALNTLGQNYRMSGLFDQSKPYFERAYALAEQLGDPTRLAFQCGSRGDLSFLLGAWDQTRVDYERAAVLAQQGSSFWAAGEAYYGLGQLALVQGQEERAAQAFQEARALVEHSHDLQTLYKLEQVLAEADLLRGRPEVAQARLALLLDREDPQRYNVTLFLPFLAWATLEVGDVPLAEALVAESIERAHRQSVILALPDALRAEARLHMHLGRLEAAEASLEQALVLCRAMPCPYTEAKVLYASGQFALQQGEPAQACERWEAALVILHRLGERLYAEQVEQALATWE